MFFQNFPSPIYQSNRLIHLHLIRKPRNTNLKIVIPADRLPASALTALQKILARVNLIGRSTHMKK